MKSGVEQVSPLIAKAWQIIGTIRAEKRSGSRGI
jgi:hypothetical protein